MQLVANDTKNKQYIYQIEARETMIKNPRSIPQKYICLARKWPKNHGFHRKTCHNSGFHRWPGVPSWRAWNTKLKTVENGKKKCSTAPKNGLEVDEGGWHEYGGVRHRLATWLLAVANRRLLARLAWRVRQTESGQRLKRDWLWVVAGRKERRRRRRSRLVRGKCGQLGTKFSQFLIGPSLSLIFFWWNTNFVLH